ncbi:MAG: hypothetical protein AB7C96_12230 [Hydrogenovibrio sp.]
MIIVKTYLAFALLWFLGLPIYWLLQKIRSKAESLSAKSSQKVAYDLGMVSISAGGFGVLVGITHETGDEELMIRVAISLIFIILGTIMVLKNIPND